MLREPLIDIETHSYTVSFRYRYALQYPGGVHGRGTAERGGRPSCGGRRDAPEVTCRHHRRDQRQLRV